MKTATTETSTSTEAIVASASPTSGKTDDNESRVKMRLSDFFSDPVRPFNEWNWTEAAFFKNLREQERVNSSSTPGDANEMAAMGFSCSVFESSTLGDTQSRQLSAITQETIATVLCTDMMNTAAAAAAAGNNSNNSSSSTNSGGSKSSLPAQLESPVQVLTPILDNYTIPITKQGPEYFASGGEPSVSSICIIMVGLPARGKTFLAQKLCRLLGWHGSRAKVLNVQTPWRRLLLQYKRCHHGKNNITRLQSVPGDSPGNSVPLWSGISPMKTTVDSRRGTMQSSHDNESAEQQREEHKQRPEELTEEEEEHHQQHQQHQEDTDYIGAEHFRALVSDPHSVERRLYRRVLERYALDAKAFYANGGDVLVVNDDFPTEELREEAEALFAPLATQTFFMEVIRDDKMNKKFNEFKVKDVLEYPPDVNANRALKDFMDRVEYLSSVYKTLTPCCDDSDSDSEDEEVEEKDDVNPTTSITTITTTTTTTTNVDNSNSNNNTNNTNNNNNNNNNSNNTTTNNNNSNSDDDDVNSTCKKDEGHGKVGGVSEHNRKKEEKMIKCRRSRRYVKLLNSSEIEVYGVTGYAASRIVSYVMNLTQMKVHHPIYFMRHGESLYNTEDRIGGDSPLTADGEKEAIELLGFLASLKEHCLEIAKEQKEDETFATSTLNRSSSCHRSDGETQEVIEIWTSQLRRAIQTVEKSEKLLGLKTLRWHSLNEIHAGVCEDLTYAEVREKYPLIDHFRRLNKYTFRYPEGESYQDLVMRLEPVIMELENADRVVVVVAHQAVLRALLAYFGGTSAESCVRLEVPHRTVWCCTYNTKGIASLHELRFAEQ
ncbi:putative 6-phosphofructo-2-kinase/fructose-2,6-biphosphatase [Trypanosoma theileri]|uniref:Putative 6-phosphofructo-2-kinase/fructose-2,6-biphosphatase n=1 Tax=Trypanosoma theileri TaxID=67003 RepID=A0A1X0NQZ4_9TRYP|nr:putative 6-phosphofructo-2-kinase/fructose-2,6-biphosphatase [Trypanosoma theileri]ORC86589.1 putative 6-phosphofructo-2-kinase/fructose-2,6-biphosphatase [Trypanosoma theileri]